MMDNKSHENCKTLIILGDPGVGKTNILLRYIKKRFEDIYNETIGNTKLT
jgi:GTPase SAR1 family protein